MLTSTPTHASKAALLRSTRVTSANSAASLPAIETSTRASTDFSQARSSSTNPAIPAPAARSS
jgi:hypothetical protein